MNFIREKIVEMAREVSMTPIEKEQALKHSKLVLPGDLILVKTPNTLYQAFRRIYSTPYDHVVVVVDSDRCLHISFPRAKLVPTYLFTHIKREPLVLRPNLSLNEIEKFLFDLKHNTVGKRYDSGRAFQYMRQSVWQNQLGALSRIPTSPFRRQYES
jgi:hypothetical protein